MSKENLLSQITNILFQLFENLKIENHLFLFILISVIISSILFSFFLFRFFLINKKRFQFIPVIFLIILIVSQGTFNDKKEFTKFTYSEIGELVNFGKKNIGNDYKLIEDRNKKYEKKLEKLEEKGKQKEKEILEIIIDYQSSYIKREQAKIIISNKEAYQFNKEINNLLKKYDYTILLKNIEYSLIWLFLFYVPIYINKELKEKLNKKVKKDIELIKEKKYKIDQDFIFCNNEIKNIDKIEDFIKVKNEYIELLILIQELEKKYQYININDYLDNIVKEDTFEYIKKDIIEKIDNLNSI